MQLQDAIRRRRMVRAYDPDRPVPRDEVKRLVGSRGSGSVGRLHARVGGSSCWTPRSHATRSGPRQRFRGDAPDARLAGLATAPVLILIFSDKDAYLDRYAEPDKGWTDRDERRWPIPYWHVDAGMAALLLLLGAVDRGLAACFFGYRPNGGSPCKRHSPSPPD